MKNLFGAAAVQYNDPDPALWMAVYGVVALCSALYVLGQVLTSVGFFDPTDQEMLGVTEAGREGMDRSPRTHGEKRESEEQGLAASQRLQ